MNPTVSRNCPRTICRWSKLAALTVALLGAGTLSGSPIVTLQSPEKCGLTHGPMLGHLATTGIRVWVRTKSPVEFRVRYSEHSDLSDSRRSDSALTVLERDSTGWVELRDLQPDTKYYYAVEIGSGLADTRVDGQFNSFRTLPDPEVLRDPRLNPKGLFNFSFEVGTGNQQWREAERRLGRPLDVTYQTMRRQLKDRIHFQIHTGDWIYEEGRDTSVEQWMAANGTSDRPAIVDLAKGITGVWQNYKVYLERGASLAAFHREIPVFVMYDDHEILNDVTGTGEVGLRVDAPQPGVSGRGPPAVARAKTRRADAEIEHTVFRDPALQAWGDYLEWSNPDVGLRQPIVFGRARLKAFSDLLFDPRANFRALDAAKTGTLHVQRGQSNTGVYEIIEVVDRNRLRIRPAPLVTEEARYSIGTNHHTRFRVGNCDFYLLDTRSHRTRHNPDDPHDPAVTMLGSRQLRWFLDEIEQSDADFFFVVSSVSFTIPHDNNAASRGGTKEESWTAYARERELLFDRFAALDRPVFLLTGDIHNSFVVRIGPQIWEFLSGPHLSSNHRMSEMGRVPLSGSYLSQGRPVEIRWGTGFLDDAPRPREPSYCVVQVNNVFNSPDARGNPRWVAYPHPQVIFSYHDGVTAELKYAEAVSTSSP